MQELTAMVYNMHHGKALGGESNLERIIKLVREIRPDIVGFNEVDRFFSKRSGFADQFSWFCGQLGEQMGMNCVFGPAIAKRKGDVLREYGNALFSRFPIVSHANHGLRSRRLSISEPRSVVEAEIELTQNRRIKVFLTHLSLIPVMRRIQAGLIAERIRQESDPVLLMGDMNMMPGSRTWRRLAEVLDDAAVSAGQGALPTYPSLRPLTQKDYIFAGKTFEVRAAETIALDPSASDHLPLVVKFMI